MPLEAHALVHADHHMLDSYEEKLPQAFLVKSTLNEERFELKKEQGQMLARWNYEFHPHHGDGEVSVGNCNGLLVLLKGVPPKRLAVPSVDVFDITRATRNEPGQAAFYRASDEDPRHPSEESSKHHICVA